MKCLLVAGIAEVERKYEKPKKIMSRTKNLTKFVGILNYLLDMTLGARTFYLLK